MKPLAVSCFVLLVTLTTCAGDASSDLAKLQTDYFAWRMEERPWQATTNKIYKHNDKLMTYSLEQFNTSKAKADEMYNRLMNVTSGDLDGQEKISYDMLKDMLVTFRNGYKWRLYSYLTPINFLEGPQFLPSSIMDIQPFDTQGDFENYLARLEKLPNQLDEIETLMREAIRLGRTNHMRSMDRLKGQFEELNVTDPIQSGFYEPFNDTLDKMSMDSKYKDQFKERGKISVKNALNAYTSFWNFIEQEYLPKTRPSIGIGSLDQGEELYAAIIRWHLSVDMAAQEIHDLGKREVERIVKQMQKIMDKQGYEGTVGEYFQALLNDSRFTFKTAEDILEEYRSLIKIIAKKVPTLFINNPGLPIEVRELTYDGPEGYSEGTADGSRPGIFWANTFRPTKSVNFTTMALTLHEVDPGHHLQLSFAITSRTPDFRQKMEYGNFFETPYSFPVYTSYVEGWGLYAESLGETMGLYRNDYDLMGRYSYEMLRACRLVVDTGMHVLGWTREQAVNYFKSYTAESQDSIEVEIDRYITWPGQALAYKIGEIKIRELRDKAKKELGEKFDIRMFHSVVLETGTVPLNILEQLVNTWIKETLKDQKPECETSGNTNMASNKILTFFISYMTLAALFRAVP